MRGEPSNRDHQNGNIRISSFNRPEFSFHCVMKIQARFSFQGWNGYGVIDLKRYLAKTLPQNAKSAAFDYGGMSGKVLFCSLADHGLNPQWAFAAPYNRVLVKTTHPGKVIEALLRDGWAWRRMDIPGVCWRLRLSQQFPRAIRKPLNSYLKHSQPWRFQDKFPSFPVRRTRLNKRGGSNSEKVWLSNV